RSSKGSFNTLFVTTADRWAVPKWAQYRTNPYKSASIELIFLALLSPGIIGMTPSEYNFFLYLSQY
ncbi:MAG: hypothetical protein WA347_07900, partial [Rhabdochlamydiaceae bacterium]